MSENFAAMRLDVSGLIDTPAGWGTRCTVKRLSTSQSASGRASGTYSAVASGTFIIEPYSKTGRGSRSERAESGFLDETAFTIFGRASANVQPEDRLVPSGSSYWYDVVSVNPANGIQLEIMARQVKKS